MAAGGHGGGGGGGSGRCRLRISNFKRLSQLKGCTTFQSTLQCKKIFFGHKFYFFSGFLSFFLFLLLFLLLLFFIFFPLFDLVQYLSTLYGILYRIFCTKLYFYNFFALLWFCKFSLFFYFRSALQHPRVLLRQRPLRPRLVDLRQGG